MRTTGNQSASESASFWSGSQAAAGPAGWGWASLSDVGPTCNPGDIANEPPPENMPLPPAECDPNGDASVCPDPNAPPQFGDDEGFYEFWDHLNEVGHGLLEGPHTVWEVLKHGMWGPLPPVFPKDLGQLGKEPPGA